MNIVRNLSPNMTQKALMQDNPADIFFFITNIRTARNGSARESFALRAVSTDLELLFINVGDYCVQNS